MKSPTDIPTLPPAPTPTVVLPTTDGPATELITTEPTQGALAAIPRVPAPADAATVAALTAITSSIRADLGAPPTFGGFFAQPTPGLPVHDAASAAGQVEQVVTEVWVEDETDGRALLLVESQPGTRTAEGALSVDRERLHLIACEDGTLARLAWHREAATWRIAVVCTGDCSGVRVDQATEDGDRASDTLVVTTPGPVRWVALASSFVQSWRPSTVGHR